MPEPTLAELTANMTDLQRQIDIASLPLLMSVQEVLNRPAVQQAIADLQEIIPNLPESIELRAPRNQAGNVVTVVSNVRGLFDGEVARISALTPTPEPEAGEPEE